MGTNETAGSSHGKIVGSVKGRLMSRVLPIVIAFSLVATAAIILLLDGFKSSGEIWFVTIEQETFRGPAPVNGQPELVVIRTQDEWQEFWGTFNSGEQSSRTFPPVNFQTEMVVAVLGIGHSSGFSVTIEKVVETAGGIAVYAEFKTPWGGSGLLPAFTFPHHIVRLARVRGDVELVVTERVAPCPQIGQLLLFADDAPEKDVVSIAESLDSDVLTRVERSVGGAIYIVSVPEGKELDLIPKFASFPEILSAEWSCDRVTKRDGKLTQ